MQMAGKSAGLLAGDWLRRTYSAAVSEISSCPPQELSNTNTRHSRPLDLSPCYDSRKFCYVPCRKCVVCFVSRLQTRLFQVVKPLPVKACYVPTEETRGRISAQQSESRWV